MNTKKIIGFNGVIDALKKGKLTKVVVDPSKKDHPKVREIIKSGILIDWKSTSNSVEGYMSSAPVGLDEILDKIAMQEKSIVVVLDSIQDVGNFGSIIRSADAFGVDLIVIPNKNSVRVNDDVIKVSSGSIANVDVVEVANLVNFIEKIKTLGFWVYGSDTSGTKNYKNAFEKKSCIVMGSEENGMRKLIKESCDFIVSIPIRIESLNVAHACAILMCEARNNG